MDTCHQPPAASELPPFSENDFVVYVAHPQRRLRVARCYRLPIDGTPQWIVEEINADTHRADELRRARLRDLGRN
jgi:hypothetical protein